MSRRYGNRIKEATSSTGTTDFALAGATAGFQPFSKIPLISPGDTFMYLAQLGTEWEIGEGTYALGSIGRTTILESTNGGAKVNFSNPPMVTNIITADEMASLVSGAVASVNGQTGVVVLDAGDVGADPVGSADTAEADAIAASQPRDPLLTAIVAAGSGSGFLNYWQAAGVSSLTMITALARSLISQDTEAGMRTVLQLGSAALQPDTAFDPQGAAASAEASAKAASQPRDADLTALAGLTGAGTARRISDGNWALDAPPAAETGAIRFEMDGLGSPLTTGIKKAIVIAPFAGTFTDWTLLADTVGTVSIEIFKSTYAGWTGASSITGGNRPALSSANKNQGNVTSWTTSFNKGDIFTIELMSAATLTHFLLLCEYVRT